MSQQTTFKTGQILSDAEVQKLSRDDKKRYGREQKVRALMALVDDPATPEHERDTAMQTLAKLITRHQIDVNAIKVKKQTGPAKIVNFEINLSNRYNLGGARATMVQWAVVGPLGGTTIKWWSASHSTSYDTRVLVFLPEDVADFAKMLIASFTMQMETALTVAVREHRRELERQWLSKREVTSLVGKFRKSYIGAWATVVGRRMELGRSQAVQEAAQERVDDQANAPREERVRMGRKSLDAAEVGKEIMLSLKQDVERASEAQKQWHKQEYGEKTKLRSGRKFIFASRDGVSAGREDGRRAQLGVNEIGGGHRRTLSA